MVLGTMQDLREKTAAILTHMPGDIVDTPFDLPTHGDIGNEPCIQFHVDKRRDFCLEVLVAPSGVYIIRTNKGVAGEPRFLKPAMRPHVIAELLCGIR